MKDKSYTKVTKYVNIDLKRQSQTDTPAFMGVIRSAGELPIQVRVQVLALPERHAQSPAQGGLFAPHGVSIHAASNPQDPPPRPHLRSCRHPALVAGRERP